MPNSHAYVISLSAHLFPSLSVCVCGNIFAHFEIIKKFASIFYASIFISRLDYKNICGIYMNFEMRSVEYPVNIWHECKVGYVELEQRGKCKHLKPLNRTETYYSS